VLEDSLKAFFYSSTLVSLLPMEGRRDEVVGGGFPVARYAECAVVMRNTHGLGE
jgi:hypothetical protein